MGRWLALPTLMVAAFGFLPPGPGAEKACGVICPKRPVCEEFWDTPVIFAGRVTAIVVDREGDDYWIRATFAVTENFRGAESTKIELVLTDSTCNPNFHVGQSWLVYATNREGRPGWTTSDCTRTRLLSEVSEDLAYLRLPDSDKGWSRIIGQFVRERFSVKDKSVARDVQPVPGVRVTARGDRDTLQATTDREGRYELRVPPHESYQISFEPPPDLRMPGSGAAVVQVSHPRGCVAADGYAHDDGRVAGRMLDAAGRPVQHFPLTLRISQDALYSGFDRHAQTDVDGRFEFRGVMPHQYTLTASTLWEGTHALAPLRREPIDVAASERVQLADLRLPASTRLVPLTLVVTDADGSPAARTRLMIRQDSGALELHTDGQGRLRLAVPAGREYEIVAVRYSRDRNRMVTETAKQRVLAQQAASVRLRLARSH